jgi:hypothetical protein
MTAEVSTSIEVHLGAVVGVPPRPGDPEVVAYVEQDPALWQLLLDWEEEYCAEPGAVDSATHLMFALERD